MPSNQELLQRAFADAPAGRNVAGLNLATQLRDNGRSKEEAAEIMREFAAGVPQTPTKYPVGEALSTLRSVYRTQPREPWAESDTDKPARKRATPVTSFRREESKPDPESQAKLEAELRGIEAFRNSPAAAYLESRGIPAELAQTAGVKYARDWAGIGECVVFPVRTDNGMLIAAQGRSIHGKEFRTLGSRGHGVFHTRKALTADVFAITEAPIDALSLELAGMPAVSMCGASGLPVWLVRHCGKKIVRDGVSYSRPVVIATDGDEAGIAASLSIRPLLESAGARTVRFLGPLKDWNDVLTQEGVSELCNQIDKQCDENDLPIPVLPDPRPERHADSGLWIRLLRMTEDMDELNGALRGFRAYGADLHVFDERAVITLNEQDSGWASQEEFDADYDRYIRPHAETLRAIPL